MTTRIDVSEIFDFAKDLDGAGSIIQQESRAVMSKSLDMLEDAIVKRTPVNAGTLRAGTAKEMMSLGFMLRGMVVNPVAYALPVEHGRSPGRMPPVDAIKQWVIRKGIASGKDADSAAFLIARAIGRRGTKGAKMFDEGFTAALPTIYRILTDWPVNIMRRLAR